MSRMRKGLGIWLAVSLACLVGPALAGAQVSEGERVPLKQDPGLFATPDQCPGSTSIVAKTGRRERAMICMIAHARRHMKRPKFARSWRLTKAARIRTQLMIRCNSLSTMPCGKSLYWIYDKTGYSQSSDWDVQALVKAIENYGDYRPNATSAAIFQDLYQYYDYVFLSSRWEHIGVDVRATKTGLVWSIDFGRGGRR